MTFDILIKQSSTLQVTQGNKYNKENVVDTKQRQCIIIIIMRPKAVKFHIENIHIYKYKTFLLNSLDISVPLIESSCFKHCSVAV